MIQSISFKDLPTRNANSELVQISKDILKAETPEEIALLEAKSLQCKAWADGTLESKDPQVLTLTETLTLTESE